MDTKVFLRYPDDPDERPGGSSGPGFLEEASSREWSTLLTYAHLGRKLGHTLRTQATPS
jgi:hypothetical protein